MSLSAAEIMQRAIISVSMDDDAATVEEIFRKNRIASAPVYGDENNLLGVITATDLVDLHAKGRDPYKVMVWEICSYAPIKVPANESVVKVAEAMLNGQVHHILVMDRNELVGIISSLDFVRMVCTGNAAESNQGGSRTLP